MSCYLITYHAQSSETRVNLEDQIRGLDGTCWNGVDNVWMIKSDVTGLEIRKRLRSVIGRADKVIVALLAGWAVWHGFDGDAEAWLKTHL